MSQEFPPNSSEVNRPAEKAEVPQPHSPLPMSPPPMSPMLPPPRISSPATANVVQPPPLPMLLAGVAMQPQAVSAILLQAQSHLPLRAVRFPVLGEYQEVFTGEEFTTWLRGQVKEFEGDLDRAEDAAKDLTEKHGLLRRLGEFGNEYEDADDAFYQFRPKVSITQYVSSHSETDSRVCRLSAWMFRRIRTRSFCRLLRRT